MSMQQDFANDYGRNVASLKALVKGLSHNETIVQPPFNANCLNWVLGHIVCSPRWVWRSWGKPLMSPNTPSAMVSARPVWRRAGPAPARRAMRCWSLQERLAAALQRATQADLQGDQEFSSRQPRWATWSWSMFG